jgi:membrane-associated phospholipid phosphatase
MNVTSSPIPAVGTAAAPRAEGKSPALLITAALSVVLFLGLALALANHVVFPFDQPILAWARTFDGSAWIWNDLSQSANFPLIAIGVGFVLWLIWSQRYREALVVIVMLVAVTAGSEGVKELTARPRPSGNGDGIPGVVYSFPSGHILECSVILGAIAIRVWRTSGHRLLRWFLVAAVLIEVVLVGVARMALNEHYPTDLLGGLLGATAALTLYAWFTRPGGWADVRKPTKKDLKKAARREAPG